MCQTLKSWIDNWSNGVKVAPPEWISNDEILIWENFCQQHPECEYCNEASNWQSIQLTTISPPEADETNVSNALNDLRSASIRNRDKQFSSLFHHITPSLLMQSFYSLRRDASPGCDKVDWDSYEENVDENIKNLSERITSWKYFPLPVRRVYIQKASGGLRPLGICTIEDKIVQMALKIMLESIYEPIFSGVSYGFRPGTRAHDALDALYIAITTRNVNYILDADIVGCFDNIDREILLQILMEKIGDPRILELIKRSLNAGILNKDGFSVTDSGVVQGSPLSPLLANIFLDYVLDKFILQWRSNSAKGEIYYVRYADDYILAFQFKEDAIRLLEIIKDRLNCAGLRLNTNKTRLIKFGKNARNMTSEDDIKVGTFDFLGFTHKCSITWKGHHFKLLRNCISSRFTRKLKAIKEKLGKMLGLLPLDKIIKWINAVLRGYYAYFAVPDNTQTLSSFRHALMKLLYKSIHRLSQRSKLTWDKFNKFISPAILYPRVSHRYPSERMAERQNTLKILRYTIIE